MKVPALLESRAVLQHRLPAVAGRPDRQGRLVQTSVPGDRYAATSRAAESIQPKSGSHVASSTNSGTTTTTAVLRSRLGLVGRRSQSMSTDRCHKLPGQIGLTWERLDATVDLIDDIRVYIDAHDLMTLVRELDGKRQADLPQRDNRDLHEPDPSRRTTCDNGGKRTRQVDAPGLAPPRVAYTPLRQTTQATERLTVMPKTLANVGPDSRLDGLARPMWSNPQQSRHWRCSLPREVPVQSRVLTPV